LRLGQGRRGASLVDGCGIGDVEGNHCGEKKGLQTRIDLRKIRVPRASCCLR
jgi:hypothetical protein